MGAEAAPEALEPVCRAIEQAGLLGITAKQIATVTAIPAAEVSRRLTALSDQDAISRVGRGLWVLRRFEAVPDSPVFRGADWFIEAFTREYGVRPVPRPGEIQFNPNERLPVHRWWPYVQGFSAGFVEATCRSYDIGRGSRVLDPFCGSGTVPLVARSLGAQGVGIDLMPITAFVAGAKSHWDANPRRLLRWAERVTMDRSPSHLREPFLKETRRQFQPPVLSSLLRLKENLAEVPGGPERELLRLAFAAILIEASDLKRSPCLGYQEKAGRTAELPFTLFLSAARQIAEDLDELQRTPERWGPPVQVLRQNAGDAPLPERSFDLSVTSPPYVNGMDYVTNYKVDLAWMDFVSSYEELRALRASMVACDNIPKATARDVRGPALDDPWVREITSRIEENLGSKSTYRRDDMALIVAKYFADLVPVIANVYRALRPGAPFVVVNGDSFIAGTYVPGDLVFARLASHLGFEVEKFEVARGRRSGQRRGFRLRESVITLRRPGKAVSGSGTRRSGRRGR